MGSETIRLPIIDFSSNTLKRDSPTWESVKTQVFEALQDFGGFEAKFDDIPPDLRKAVLDGLHQLFNLPIPTKKRNISNTGKLYHGYIGKFTPDSLYESLGVEDPLAPGEVEAFTNLMWPQGNPIFSKSVESYLEKLYDLERIICWMVAESLGLEKYMDTDMDRLNYILRFQRYDAPHSVEKKVGLPPHTDKGFVSMLYQNMVSGLEFLTKDGQWITAATSVNSFVVLIGDAYHAWTNGRLHPPIHRVTMAGDEASTRLDYLRIQKQAALLRRRKRWWMKSILYSTSPSFSRNISTSSTLAGSQLSRCYQEILWSLNCYFTVYISII